MKCDDILDLNLEVATAGQFCKAARAGTVAFELPLWDGRTVIGTHSNKPADVKTLQRMFQQGSMMVEPFIRRLVDQGTSFIAEYGEGDKLRTLEWTIAWEEEEPATLPLA